MLVPDPSGLLVPRDYGAITSALMLAHGACYHRTSYDVISLRQRRVVCGGAWTSGAKLMVRATRPRAFHAIVEQIRGDIFAQRRRPGDRLPSEPLLAEHFGVSRTGVREALRVLELQGLVEVRHGYAGGAFVSEPDCAPIVGALEVSLRHSQVDVDELYQARLLFEPAVTRLAVGRDPEALATRLADNMARTRRALAERAPVSALNREFHLILAEHAGNRVLALIMQPLQAVLETLDERHPNTPTV